MRRLELGSLIFSWRLNPWVLRLANALLRFGDYKYLNIFLLTLQVNWAWHMLLVPDLMPVKDVKGRELHKDTAAVHFQVGLFLILAILPLQRLLVL